MRLLILGCSDRKHTDKAEGEAWHIYNGVFFRLGKKLEREGKWPADVEVFILSAKYGLIAAGEQISPYDQRMTPNVAAAIHDQAVGRLKNLIASRQISEVFIAAGAVYREAISPFFLWSRGIPVSYPSGGIGDQQTALKAWLLKE